MRSGEDEARNKSEKLTRSSIRCNERDRIGT